MKRYGHILVIALLAALAVAGYAMSVPRLAWSAATAPPDTVGQPKAQPTLANEDEIPDSLLNTRWKVQRTMPITDDDLRQNAMDLERPENLQQEVQYNDTLDSYVIGKRMAGGYVNTPVMMTTQEYLQWSEERMFRDFFKKKNTESYEAQGKEKFDFTDMHFDLGPAEKVFGPGGVRIKTQGSAELKFGLTMKNVDNPSLPIRNRKTTTMDFDEKINLNMNGKVGDKVNMNLNYNTDATVAADAQNMKLKYDGKEDEIIKLVEAGNVSFPANSSLIRGASSLFGLRTDLQFGKLKLQTVVSQKKSSNTSVSSKGGVQLTTKELNVANYEENRHFFLSQYFRDHYGDGMKTLPNLMTGVKINRVEVWVTNKRGTTQNTRNIIALTDLGENSRISNPIFTPTGMNIPANASNTAYSQMVGPLVSARDIDQTATTLDGAGLVGGTDYEKLESAVLLSSSEYKVNAALGYITLNTTLLTDQVLAVAFEYTYGGQTYQVGEFASDLTDVSQALFVKTLKNTSNNPAQGNWDLMMKNAYRLDSSIEKDKFRFDVKFQSDTAGVYLSYIPETQVKDLPLIRLMGADRLDNNNKPHPNGYFDFVDGYTVNGGTVFFPTVEPFGVDMYATLVAKGVSEEVAMKYAFTELYDSTQTVAKQIAEKNKYQIVAQYRGRSSNVISLGAVDVPEGSVVVTAGGVTLTEGTDYTVDYSAGEVRILNQSIIDAGTNINVSSESNTDYGQMRKTMLGLNWEYDFTKNFQMSGTIQHLYEQALTSKVAMGAEPLNNTLWGVNINWKKESQWLTNLLDKIPLLHLTQPSNISFVGEFAQLIAGQSRGTQDNASYLDDFENTTSKADVSTPTSWTLSSVPSMFPEYNDKTTLRSGYNRAQMAWYTIDPLFTRRSSSLTPGHIKSDLDQLSNHYVREVAVRELYPNRDQSTYNGATSMLPILNVAYYPNEPGPYNFNPDLNRDGSLNNPRNHWGGMMRRLNTTDFEEANIEYIEFWLMDPFIYSRRDGTESQYGGDLYFNLGEVSEDILRDGKKFYESGMPVDGSQNFTTTQWGKIPTQTTVTYAFATNSGSRAMQDVGFNGLNDAEERTFPTYQDYLTQVQSKVDAAVWDSIYADPARDNYHYFRGSDYDQMQASILRRYKYINNPQGNSPDSDTRSESYDTSYKTTPDVEDINQDYTLNEYEKYYQYHVSLRAEDLVVGQNFIVDKREGEPTLRNGNKERVTWYQFRIPVDDFEQKFGAISDFSSIRFMRMFLTNFEQPIVLRFGSLDLVRGEWRVYEQNLDNVSGTGKLNVSEVNIEENNDKSPVNYVLPPGIRRVQDPSQPQLVESNEQSLDMVVSNLSSGESKAVYKNTFTDLRQYKRLQLFVHANALEQNTTNLQDNQLAVFIRLGSDYKSNYYEYEIPLKLTAPSSNYDRYSPTDVLQVWPEDNMLDVPLSIFTDLKRQRNRAKAEGIASYSQAFSVYDDNRPNNRITIMGNPSLGEVKTMIIGVRNKSSEVKSGEIWVNELRLKEYNNEGGWAAQGNLNMQLSDLGTLNMQGRYMSEGFGGLEEGVATRSTDNYKTYSVTTSLDLGKFFPDKAKASVPFYYSVSKEESSPKYNPLDTDMELRDALDATVSQHERDSIEGIAVTKTTTTNFSLSNVRLGLQIDKKHPTPIDPANFSFSYSHSHRNTSGETTVHEKEDNWQGRMAYQWVPVYKAFEPFKKKIKSKSKWMDLPKQLSFNWLPQNISFNTDISRNYYELQERDMEDLGGSSLPLTFDQQFLWNRDFSMKWDFTKNLHMSFQSATRAEIEEPYTPINKDLYPDRYEAWKDSVRTSLRDFGAPLDYSQNFDVSYKLPLNLLPVFSWVNADASYKATYSWVRGSNLEDGTSLGNTITNNRTVSLNSSFNLEKLYGLIPFLKATNDRFNKEVKRTTTGGKTGTSNANNKPGAAPQQDKNAGTSALNQQLPKNQKGFEGEITLLPDTAITVKHGKKSKRLIVTAKTEDGHFFPIKYKATDDNTIKVLSKVDTATHIKVTVTAKEPLENLTWYRTAQSVARLLMMVRNVSVTYRNTNAMGLPGFMPTIGDAFGQRRGDILSPGLDFAFGTNGDDYIEKARSNGWLLQSDSVATPATTSTNEDLQLRMTVEPIRNLKIDLNASRTQTKGKSIQYMYVGNPTTQTGTFNMTTISIGTAFEGMGNAGNGYHSKSFERFCNSLDGYRQRVENRYADAVYPLGSPLAGQHFDVQNGGVNQYSADVLIPAFLDSYTNMKGNSLDIFPSLSRLLPNWSVTYSGLSKLTWFRNTFKSVNLKHSYKSVFAVGSYSTYSTYMEFMDGLGFITDATTGMPIPNSMYNISTASINEQLQPFGVDVTFNNNMTAGIDFKKTRVLTLSMTSMQVNETTSDDWTVKWGYKINDFNIFGGGANAHRKVKTTKKDDEEQQQNAQKQQPKKNGVNHDLNLNASFTYRQQAAIIRDIASMSSTANNGNKNFKFSLMADYTLSKLLTMTFYYEQLGNTPLLSSSSYPTTTRDFGFSLKFSLTR